MRYLTSAPGPAIRCYESGRWNEGNESEIVAFANALLTDQRMSEVWKTLAATYNRDEWFDLKFPRGTEWGEVFWWAAVSRFKQAMNPEPWDALTRTEQREWLDKLDQLVELMSAHLAVGPLPPVCLSSYVPNSVLEDLARAAGGAAESGPVRNAGWRTKWGLAEALHHYASKMREIGVDDQWMRRPRHSKSARERFIFLLSGDCDQYFGQAMQEVVAATASVAFDDDSITARLVRRITKENLYRQDSPEAE